MCSVGEHPPAPADVHGEADPVHRAGPGGRDGGQGLAPAGQGEVQGPGRQVRPRLCGEEEDRQQGLLSGEVLRLLRPLRAL